jgi:transketolase
MTDGTKAAAGQQISDTFTGNAGASAALKPKDQKATVKGIQAAAIPAFVAGMELADMAGSDPRIVVLTADLAGAGRTADFRDRHPDRFFNMGVAEQNMISVAAGMAASGLRPFVSTFAAYVALLG